jgi:hypothetical protein
MQNHLTMRPAAALASRLRALKPDDARELAPVDRVKPAELRADGHNSMMVDAGAFDNHGREGASCGC